MQGMTMLWLRHGETALNAARIMQPAETPLSPRGQAQAEAAARRLAALRPAAILSSDLPRALQTAQALAALTGLPVETEPLLQERNFGALRGRPWDELGFDAVNMVDAPEGGESLAQFQARCDAAWAVALAHRARLDGPLVVVSHGLLIHAVLSRRVHWPPGQALPEWLANTSVSEIEAEPPHAALRAGCIDHLPADL
jgi:broad specificity phosphatase PhoE